MYSRVYLEITNICNRNCSFCIGTSREARRMTMEEFQEIAKKLRPHTEYLYYHLMGEPLTHPLLPDFIRYAGTLGFHSAITTNGTLLARRGAELIAAGVYKVSISVHSFEKGSDEEYLAYIRDCLNFADEASARGVLVCLRLWNRGYDEGRNLDTLALIRERFPDGEWKWSARGARIRKGLHLEYGDRFAWPDLSAPDMGDEVYCYGLKDHFGVLVDGSVVPCCLDHNGVVTLGNLHGESLDEILASPRAVAMARGFSCRHATEELCRRCGYARRFDVKQRK
ncbi:MAG: radical SAM protein [Clostridia bacterium]|nr:radical SAM protein [Clostridia bacterium]